MLQQTPDYAATRYQHDLLLKGHYASLAKPICFSTHRSSNTAAWRFSTHIPKLPRLFRCQAKSLRRFALVSQLRFDNAAPKPHSNYPQESIPSLPPWTQTEKNSACLKLWLDSHERVSVTIRNCTNDLKLKFSISGPWQSHNHVRVYRKESFGARLMRRSDHFRAYLIARQQSKSTCVVYPCNKLMHPPNAEKAMTNEWSYDGRAGKHCVRSFVYGGTA